MLEHAKVTVGLVTYDRPNLLQESVRSVMAQSYPNFRLIITNDNPKKSIDFDSLGMEPDRRVKIINKKNNVGEIENLNFALNLCRTEFFTWLCDDDILHPDYLENTMSTFNEFSDQNIVSVYTNCETGPSIGQHFFKKTKNIQKKIFSSEEFLNSYLSRKLDLIGCYGLVNTRALRQIGGIARLGCGFSPYSDTLIPIQLLQHGEVAYLNSKLIFLRTHSGSMSFSSTDFNAYSTAEEDFLIKFKQCIPSAATAAKKKKWLFELICWFADNEWTVLSRSDSKNLTTLFFKFWVPQFVVNLMRLPIRYRSPFVLFNFKIASKQILTRIRKKMKPSKGSQ